jgi:hypothetical protein
MAKNRDLALTRPHITQPLQTSFRQLRAFVRACRQWKNGQALPEFPAESYMSVQIRLESLRRSLIWVEIACGWNVQT